MNKNLIEKSISVNGINYNYKFYCTYKRSISISLNRKNEIIVRGSKLFSNVYIENFIKKHIEKFDDHRKLINNNLLINLNEYLIIDKKKYILKWIVDKKNFFVKRGDCFYIHTKNDRKKDKIYMIKSIYFFYTKKIISNLDRYINNVYKNLDIPFVTIDAKWLVGKWGYCNVVRRQIFISTLCAAFSIDTIKYLIVHEIAHLKHHGHGKDFWQTVASIVPNYKLLNKNFRHIKVI